MQIYMFKTLELMAQTDSALASNIASNSKVVQSEKAGTYFIINNDNEQIN